MTRSIQRNDAGMLKFGVVEFEEPWPPLISATAKPSSPSTRARVSPRALKIVLAPENVARSEARCACRAHGHSRGRAKAAAQKLKRGNGTSVTKRPAITA